MLERQGIAQPKPESRVPVQVRPQSG